MKKNLPLFVMFLTSLSLNSTEKGLDERINDFFEPYANDWEALDLICLPLWP